MTALRNPRHETFARELAAGRSATEAYRIAAGKDNRRYASELGHRPDITGRIAEILAEKAGQDAAATARATAALAITKEWLIARTEEARALAMANNQTSAAVAAIKELGILSGLRIERRENLNRSIDDLTDEELADIIRAGSGANLH